jgi:uncharacterized protein (DUF1684 family)
MSLSLLDWRRLVGRMYSDVRLSADEDPENTLRNFRLAKDELFRSHPDSPLPAGGRRDFDGLAYWPYDPTLRQRAAVQSVEPAPAAATSISGETFALRRIGVVRLPIGELEVFWIDVYGGGVFVPFRDATSGTDTYGAGRYLLDTVKGADLGGNANGLVLDFNYAYHPSCVYDAVWSCPLAPRANWLDAPVRAGERLTAD